MLKGILRRVQRGRVPVLSTISSAVDFHEMIKHECKRANRYGRRFSLAVFEIGTSDENSVTARQLVRSLHRRFRRIDDVGWFDRNQIGVILPYTPSEGAWKLAEDVCGLVSTVLPSPPFTIYTYPSSRWPVSLLKFNWRYYNPIRFMTRLVTRSTIRNSMEFHALMELERDRADRAGLIFSLVLFDVTMIERLSISVEHLVHALNLRLRITDIVGWYGEDTVAVLLPYATGENATKIAEGLCQEKGIRPSSIFTVYTYPSNWFPATQSEPVRRQRNGQPVSEAPPPPNGAFQPSVEARKGRRASDQPPIDPSKAMAAVEPQHGQDDDDDDESDGDGWERDPLPLSAPRRSSENDFEPFVVRSIPVWKRSMDVAGALVGLGMSSFLMAPIALSIRMTSDGPVFFRQIRAGLGGQPFVLYKFRTMVVGAEEQKAGLAAQNEREGPVFKMKDDPRVTGIGKFLRTWSLDELPQFFNVLKGDMSLVGPRPPTVDEVIKYYNWHDKRLEIKPGITCLWQVYARHESSFDDWVRLDIQYARSRSFLLDCKILTLTFPAVLSRRGAT